jgi:hypothetical protein
MPAPELTLRTSGITCRTESYGGPDNDVRLTALGELCVDLQRLARSTLVKIGASDSPASSSASAAPNRLRKTRGSQQHPPRNDRPPHRLGKCLADRRGSPHSCRPPRGRGHVGPDQGLPGWWSWSEAAEVRWGRHFWGCCRPGRQVSADPYSGAMRRTNCGSQTRSWMTPSSRGAVVRRYFSSSGVAFASTQGTARRMWR